MAQRYFLTLADPAKARGSEASLSFRSVGADGFAQELEAALRTPRLFEAWRDMQQDPEEVDPALVPVGSRIASSIEPAQKRPAGSHFPSLNRLPGWFSSGLPIGSMRPDAGSQKAKPLRNAATMPPPSSSSRPSRTPDTGRPRARYAGLASDTVPRRDPGSRPPTPRFGQGAEEPESASERPSVPGHPSKCPIAVRSSLGRRRFFPYR